MLRSAGIDPEEFNKHKGAAVKAVEFYQNMINVQPSTSDLPLVAFPSVVTSSELSLSLSLQMLVPLLPTL